MKTSEWIYKALEMQRRGLTQGQIAAEIGVTRNSVCGALDRYKKREANAEMMWPDHVLLRLLDLRERQGKCWGAIGDLLDQRPSNCSVRYAKIIRDLEESEKS